MDIGKMLEELRAEREAINEAIVTLERLSVSTSNGEATRPHGSAEMRARDVGGGQPEPSKLGKKSKPRRVAVRRIAGPASA